MTTYRARRALAAYRAIQALREPRHRITPAGRFWFSYFLILALLAWMLA
ncbi:MAG: hypothetical protein IT531_00235 [Burkholderiales bacterium]|nr:hypothetical protein [Burkholderiales bacterium]